MLATHAHCLLKMERVRELVIDCVALLRVSQKVADIHKFNGIAMLLLGRYKDASKALTLSLKVSNPGDSTAEKLSLLCVAKQCARDMLLAVRDDHEDGVDRAMPRDRFMRMSQHGLARDGAILFRHIAAVAAALACGDDQRDGLWGKGHARRIAAPGLVRKGAGRPLAGAALFG